MLFFVLLSKLITRNRACYQPSTTVHRKYVLLSKMHFANILILIYALPKFIFAMPPPPDLSGPAPTTWPDCQQSLSCTFAAIQSSSLAARLTYIQNMQSDFFADELKCPTQWRAIEGVIEFFQSKDQGAPGTWVSYTDAGIIEAVQRGGAIALGLSNEDGGNPGSQLWADFMTNMKNGKLDDRSVSLAERNV